MRQRAPIDWVGVSTRFLPFTGKGGVGETTIASTVAVALADFGRRVLLVSTEPVSNLSDVFEMKTGEHPTAVSGISWLEIMDLDPHEAAAVMFLQQSHPTCVSYGVEECVAPAVSGGSDSGEDCSERVEAAGYCVVPDPQAALLTGHEPGIDEDLHVVTDCRLRTTGRFRPGRRRTLHRRRPRR